MLQIMIMKMMIVIMCSNGEDTTVRTPLVLVAFFAVADITVAGLFISTGFFFYFSTVFCEIYMATILSRNARVYDIYDIQNITQLTDREGNKDACIPDNRITEHRIQKCRCDTYFLHVKVEI